MFPAVMLGAKLNCNVQPLMAVLPVSNKFTDYAKAVAAELSAAGIRATLDDRNEKLQAKIRDSEMQKIPYMTVVGGKEAEARTVSVRHHGQGDVGAQPLAEFVAKLREEAAARTTS